MILPIAEKRIRKVEIDLTGPDGDFFVLMGIGVDLCKLLNERRGAEYFNVKKFCEDMMSGDYEHAVNLMEKNFGHLIIMYR